MMLHNLYDSLKIKLKSLARNTMPVLRRMFGERGAFLFLAGVVGALAGFCAFLLKTMIGGVTDGLTSWMGVESARWELILLPVAGVLLTGIFTRYVVKMPLEHGCERLHRDMANHIYRMRSRLTVSPMISATLTLGFGGSAGSEGPIAYTGAAIGSNLGRMFSLSDRQMRILVGIGAGAGIAGIFKAPIGGMLFTLEVLGMTITTVNVIALVTACLLSGAIASACSGYTLDVNYHSSVAFGSDMLFPLLALGVFCGLYSLWYSFCMSRSQRLIMKLNNPWVRNVSTGLFIGLMLFLFPCLYGEGYGTVDELINGQFASYLDMSLFYGGGMTTVMLVTAGVLIVKGLVVQATNSGGGVAGDFAPTLFAGALCGFLFATFSNTVLGTHIAVADFAFFGMAAVMAGTIQAPLMALFLTEEMTGDLSMLLPLMIAAAISYGMVRLCRSRWREIFRPVWNHHLHRL